MNPILRGVIYLLLVVGGVLCGREFMALYSARMERAAHRFDQTESTNASPATVSGPGLSTARSRSFMGAYAAITLGSVVGLALMLSRDISHLLATRTHKALYNEEGEGMANPEYEQAEQVWADGNHLEAIRLMREYLRKNPREVHVALRIAEIYEKDLSNHLAAALEYEEVLKCRLDPERWGWSAIHLCNLYYRLDQAPKAEALLSRIVAEHGQTAAAKKARERLGLPEDATKAAQEAEAGAGEEDQGGFKLPPGFRPKKT